MNTLLRSNLPGNNLFYNTSQHTRHDTGEDMTRVKMLSLPLHDIYMVVLSVIFFALLFCLLLLLNVNKMEGRNMQ